MNERDDDARLGSRALAESLPPLPPHGRCIFCRGDFDADDIGPVQVVQRLRSIRARGGGLTDRMIK